MDTIDSKIQNSQDIVHRKHELILDAIAQGLDQTIRTEDKTGELASSIDYMTSPEYPNLTRDEEAFFHSVMWEGVSAQEELKSSNGNLSSQQNESLISKIEDGKLAFEILVLSVQGLAWSIARRYHSVDTEDLVQQANIAIIRAVKSFDPQKGKLSTHVTWLIRSELYRNYRQLESQIPLPAQLHSRVKKLKLVTQQLEITLGRRPTDEEIAEEMKLDVKIIRKVQKATIEIESMDIPLPICSTKTLANIIEDPSPTPEDQFITVETLLKFIKAFHRLNPNDQEILSQRYGFILKDNILEPTHPLSAEKFSEITGMNPSTVAYQTTRARLKLLRNL